MAYGTSSTHVRRWARWLHRVWFHTKLYTGPQEVDTSKLSPELRDASGGTSITFAFNWERPAETGVAQGR
jgi:hypothetical protein